MISSPSPPVRLSPPRGSGGHQRAGPRQRLRERLARAATDLRPARHPDRWAAVGVAVLALVLYVRSLLPGIGYSGDTAKWQFLGAVGGTPHPTGYPLYLALNKAWVTLVPWGSLAWRANLLSAVCGAAAVGLLVLLLRALDVRLAVAAATAATFAASLTFWSQAVVAEVYTLHLLLLTAVTLCLARWRAGGGDVWLRVAIALVALSFGNHLGTVLAVPGLAWVAWTDPRRVLTARNAAFTVVAAVAGAAQYGYLLWMGRVGGYHEQSVRDWGDVLDMVTGGRFRDDMFAFGLRALVVDRLPMLARLAWGEQAVLLALSAAGVVVALRGRHRPVAVHLLILGTLATVYALGFGVDDVFVFFLPAWLVLAVFLGVGADALAARVAPHLPAGAPGRALAVLALVGVPMAMGLVNYGRASQRGATAVADRMERLVEAAGSDALIVTDNYADSEYVWYHLLGEGLADERDLALGNQVAPSTVVAFVRDGRGRLTRVATPGTPVFTATENQAEDLAAAGLVPVEVAADVWLVVDGPPPGP